jgi:hypothetical protein
VKLLPGGHRAQLLVGEIVDGSGAQLERCLNFGHDRYSGDDESSALDDDVVDENSVELTLRDS